MRSLHSLRSVEMTKERKTLEMTKEENAPDTKKRKPLTSVSYSHLWEQIKDS